MYFKAVQSKAGRSGTEKIYSPRNRIRCSFDCATIATAYVALGSNIDASNNLNLATNELRNIWPDCLVSSIYQSPSLLNDEQEDFLNAVIQLESDDDPHVILHQLQAIEQKLAKATAYRWGPRSIDLDFLLYDDLIMPDKTQWTEISEQWQERQEHELVLPHPQMHLRRFVLEPLCELIDPTGTHPVLQRSWRELLEECGEQELSAT